MGTTCVAKNIARFYDCTRSCPGPGWVWRHSANAFRKQSATSKITTNFYELAEKKPKKTPRKIKKKITSRKKTSEKTNKESEKNQSKLKTDVHRAVSKNEWQVCPCGDMSGQDHSELRVARTIPLGLHLCHKMLHRENPWEISKFVPNRLLSVARHVPNLN